MKGKEFFNKKKKIIVAAIILILLVVISIPISVHFYNLHNYNKYLELGQANLNKEKFDEAANDYKSALKYQSKNKEVINQKLSLVKLLKESKQKYDQAILLFNDKKYLDAINDFNDISKDDKNYYKKAQDKITECKTSYINDNISKAKTDADSKNYSEAITFLDTVLKFDSTCKEASSLKEQYNNEIQKIKDEEAAAKKKA
ncbi:MAG: hypothetical protein Q8900_13955, partial [Bacillota bacterium]|nr:hypothetical protein [Bacillota bacterium]